MPPQMIAFGHGLMPHASLEGRERPPLIDIFVSCASHSLNFVITKKAC